MRADPAFQSRRAIPIGVPQRMMPRLNGSGSSIRSQDLIRQPGLQIAAIGTTGTPETAAR